MHAKVLWDLQKVDQKLENISGEIKQKQLIFNLKDKQTKIEEIQQAIGREKKEINDLEKNAKKQEQELLALESLKVDQEKKLYEGSSNNPKELESMKVQLDQLKEQVSQLENQVLSIMDILEDKVQLLHQSSGKLEILEKEYSKGVKLYQKNKRELGEAKNSTEQIRAELVGELGESLSRTYQRVQQSYKNAGIARVENGLCSGCRVEIPIMHLKNVKEGTSIYTCEQCGRILVYWDEAITT